MASQIWDFVSALHITSNGDLICDFLLKINPVELDDIISLMDDIIALDDFSDIDIDIEEPLPGYLMRFFPEDETNFWRLKSLARALKEATIVIHHKLTLLGKLKIDFQLFKEKYEQGLMTPTQSLSPPDTDLLADCLETSRQTVWFSTMNFVDYQPEYSVKPFLHSIGLPDLLIVRF